MGSTFGPSLAITVVSPRVKRACRMPSRSRPGGKFCGAPCALISANVDFIRILAPKCFSMKTIASRQLPGNSNTYLPSSLQFSFRGIGFQSRAENYSGNERGGVSPCTPWPRRHPTNFTCILQSPNGSNGNRPLGPPKAANAKIR